MGRILGGAAVAALSVSTAYAGGLDRSGQPIGIIFEEGNYAELSFGFTDPSLSGTDIIGADVNDVGDSFTSIGAGLKLKFNDNLDVAFIFDQPFGADVRYGDETPVLGGTFARANTKGLTAILRYKFNENFSIHGGARRVEASGAIGLGGLAYGGLDGYLSDYSSDAAWGYVLGAAYEVPDIALRVALTYSSEIDIELETAETLNGVPLDLVIAGATFGTVSDPRTATKTTLPKSINLDFQTGIAQDTLLFGGIRWAEWSAFKLAPPKVNTLAGLTGDSVNLADLDDSTTYTLGVARRFTDDFAGSVSISYEDIEDGKLVSPLSPTSGQLALTIGGRYDISDNVRLSGGIRYTQFGDARPETGTPDTERASFKNNDAISVGFKIGYTF